MTTEEAKDELIRLRKTQDRTAARITELTAFLKSKGAATDTESDIRFRNNMIHQLYMRGKDMEKIAVSFKLTPAKVKQICREMDALRKKRARKL